MVLRDCAAGSRDHYRKSSRTTALHQEVGDVSTIAAPVSPESGQLDDLAALLKPLSEGEREVVEMLKVEECRCRK